LEAAVKSNDASEKLGVQPNTTYHWIKQHNIPCEKNDFGHYVLDEEALQKLLKVKSQAEQKGNQLLKSRTVRKGKVNDYEKRMDQMIRRIDQMEQSLSQKANDVVSYQLLHHRSDLNEMMNKLIKLEKSVELLAAKNDETALNDESSHTLPKRKKGNWLLKIFGFSS
jgi:chromosome-anchoring protein RacA